MKHYSPEIQAVYDAEYNRVLSTFSPDTRDLPLARDLATVSARSEANYAEWMEFIAEAKASLHKMAEALGVSA